MKIQRTNEFEEWFNRQTEKSKAQIDGGFKNAQKKNIKEARQILKREACEEKL